MIDRRLKTFIVIFLWAALVEDIVIFLLAWLAPDIWFRLFHATVPAGLETALLRRSAGQWGRVRTRPSRHTLALAEGPRLARRVRRGAFFRFVHRRVVHPRRTVANETRLDLAGATSFS